MITVRRSPALAALGSEYRLFSVYRPETQMDLAGSNAGKKQTREKRIIFILVNFRN